MDSEVEEAFDRITRLAARVLRAPVTLVSLVDHQRQFFKSAFGLPDPWASRRQTPLSHSFCQHVVRNQRVIAVDDARYDLVMRDNLAVRDLNVIAYAGAPLMAPSGEALGAFCAIDGRPRVWMPDEIHLLQDFAALASSEINSRAVMRSKLRALLELQNARARFRTLVENCPVPTFIKDEQLRFAYVNSASLRNYPNSHEWVGKRNEDIFPPDIARRMNENDQRVLAGGSAELVEECLPLPDGSEGHWLSYLFPIPSSDGKMMLAGVSLNITERHNMEEELRRAKEQAETANRTKGQFLAHMSHEIRTPLTAILGYSDLLRDPNLSPSDREEFVATVRRNGEHLLSVVNDILDLSRIEAGAMKLEPIQTDVRALIRGVVEQLGPRAAGKNLRLDLSLDPHVPSKVETDPTRLRQIVTNLISNAIKFTQHGGVLVRLGADASGSQIEISVADTGIGIPAEQQARLFEPFMQADVSFARKYGGTGLGLAISWRLARLLEGSISVRSSPGVGSTFVLSVPMMLPVRRGGQIPGGQVSPGGSRPRVLLVEDCVDNQRLIRLYLERMGLRVDWADNGTRAVSMMREALAGQTTEIEGGGPGQPISLVIMDCQMPQMDGFTATCHLRELGYLGPIIAVTANAMVDDRERCLSAGCDAYLTKPIDQILLEKMVREYLMKPSATVAA